jgi:hypothetical protein
MPNYKPKTEYLKHQIAKKTRDFRGYNIAEGELQTKQMKHMQSNPRFLTASTKKLADEISADVTAYIRDKNKSRGTQSSTQRKVIK